MFTLQQLAHDLKKLPLKGKTVGLHSQPSSLGEIEPSTLSLSEASKGMKPFAKTVINALLDAVGPKGTLFVPTHSNNHVGNTQYSGDDLFYHPDKSPSNVGSLTQSFLFDDRAVRSLHPTHSIAAIGPEAGYLAKNHTPEVQPVGIHNAFAKTAGLDGVILFIGDILKSNTSFHAYETLLLPGMGSFFEIIAAAEHNGEKRHFTLSWHPHRHREFYAEGRRNTRAFAQMRKKKLVLKGRLGNAPLYYFHAKKAARFFASEVFPRQPDVLFCLKPQTCTTDFECGQVVARMKELYSRNNSAWDAQKIRKGMCRDFLELLKKGPRRLSY